MQIQLDLERLKTYKIHFMIPCYGGMVSEQTMVGVVKWAKQAAEMGIDWTMDTLVNESLISRGRNTLAAKFLVHPETTHLFFIDADIGFEPWHVLTLMNQDKDVMCGLYPMKSMPIKWVVNGVPGVEADENFAVEVSKAGTGFMMIKRHVLEECKKHPAVKKFTNDIGLPVELDPQMYTFFDTAVREGRYYSEDWTFCENWRDLGGKIHVDTRVLLKHQGSFNFCHENDVAVREAVATTPSTVTSIDDSPVVPNDATPAPGTIEKVPAKKSTRSNKKKR